MAVMAVTTVFGLERAPRVGILDGGLDVGSSASLSPGR